MALWRGCGGQNARLRKSLPRIQLHSFRDNCSRGLQSGAVFPMLKASKCKWINQRRLWKGRGSKVKRERVGKCCAGSYRCFQGSLALIRGRGRPGIGPVVVGREMAITKEKKQEIIGTFGRAEVDTGSPEVQVALLTARINDLTDHFKTHAKDHASRRGLLMMVSKRSSLLKYLRLHNRKKYLEVINRLGIRK